MRVIDRIDQSGVVDRQTRNICSWKEEDEAFTAANLNRGSEKLNKKVTQIFLTWDFQTEFFSGL